MTGARGPESARGPGSRGLCFGRLMILSALKTLLETGEALNTPGARGDQDRASINDSS
jgi:hypothetical protein